MTYNEPEQVTCPNCGNPANAYYYTDNVDQWYCPHCGQSAAISRMDGLPCHPKFRRPCINPECDKMSPGVQSLHNWACGKHGAHRQVPTCAEPGCDKRSNRSTRQAPWRMLCTDHRDALTGPTAIGKTRRNRRKSRSKAGPGFSRYRKVRMAALERDSHTCQWCGNTEDGTEENRIEVDHIREKWEAPELEYDLSNLQTLCRACHSAKGVAVRAALYQLARENPLHYTALVDQHIAQARDTKAH